MKKTVVFDFDGVIHSYTSGWKGAATIPDPPIPGIKEEIEKISEKYHVVVVSQRCASPGGKEAIMKYLEENGIVVDDVVMEKPPAVCYVDDRAIRFDGIAGGLLEKIDSFRSWLEKEKAEKDNEFVKPDHIQVQDRDYIERLIKASLVKDLQTGEEICQMCHGTGMVVRNNVYGLEGDPDRTKLFPYVNQSISFCPACYNGVVSRCKLCGGLLQRGRLKHDCEAQKKRDREERERKEREAEQNAPEATQDMIADCVMLYSECFSGNEGFFEDWDSFFDDWADEHTPEDPKPEWAWTTEPIEMQIDADRVLEMATEDLYEDAETDISDAKRKELQTYLNNFCKTCGVSTAYIQGKYKVRIPWEDFHCWEE